MVNHIGKKKTNKLYEECERSYGYDYMIQASSNPTKIQIQRVDLIDAIELILELNKKI